MRGLTRSRHAPLPQEVVDDRGQREAGARAFLALVEDLGHGGAVDELVWQVTEPGLVDEVARVDPVRHGVEVAPDPLGRGEDPLGLTAFYSLGPCGQRRRVLRYGGPPPARSSWPARAHVVPLNPRTRRVMRPR